MSHGRHGASSPQAHRGQGTVTCTVVLRGAVLLRFAAVLQTQMEKSQMEKPPGQIPMV